MTDLELASRLKAAPVPDRPHEYWDDFPSRVRMQLRRPQTVSAPRPVWQARLVWSADFALVVLLIFICLQCHPLHATSALIANQQRHFQSHLARLDAGLHKLLLNTDGMGYLLVESN